ncbi:CBL-interacting serine/threonine-protein kinase 4-like [Senna tora]|uniref:non-specific serine/threonine protein kinase n=1 Tax=Senna tora TaxID=362788 RepID=A0A834X590_9FABA|nr:CBL-interacting serine/threonine-protein kinase 4-like [Senna tora]
MVSQPPSPLPSETIIFGKYRLTRLLGRGSFAKVYYAESLRDGSTVAVKIIDKVIMGAAMESLVIREIDAMRRLQHHPNILKIHEVMASKTKIYLVVEFAPGGELGTRIVKKGRIPEPLARRYFQQVVSALRFCHGNGVAHRDIKPQNLLLDKDGDVKVSDFGLSALPEQLNNGLLKTACGTPCFTAPEILHHRRYDGSKADAWSCGVLLYVMLTGYLPFNDSNMPMMFRRINSRSYVFPAYISGRARSVIHNLLHPDPLHRMSLEDLFGNPWFMTSLRPEPEKSIFGSDNNTGSKYAGLNAFDIISMSPGLDLRGLFETTSENMKEKRFVSNAKTEVVVEKIKEIGGRLGFKVELGKNGSIGMGKGKVVVVFEVFEIVAGMAMVAVRVEDGGLEFEERYWNDWKLGLQDVVCSLAQ